MQETEDQQAYYENFDIELTTKRQLVDEIDDANDKQTECDDQNAQFNFNKNNNSEVVKI